MGRHNGKSRSSGGHLPVGSALTNKHKKGKKPAPASSTRHTTDVGGMQSVLEASDLGEFMELVRVGGGEERREGRERAAFFFERRPTTYPHTSQHHTPYPQASLANRDFAAEKACDAVIVDSVAVDDPEAAAAAAQRSAAATAAAEPLLTLPRRPPWSPDMSPEALDASERAAFLEWRRGLAALEADPALTLTPFEKNVKVWRQLWRVVERSHVVVQVVDGRDPLRYYSADLGALAAEAATPAPPPKTLVLLNKADLLPARVREAWADHFAKFGVDAVFWSAKAADDATKAAAAEAAAAALGVPPPPPPPPTTNDAPPILTVDQLLDALEDAALAGRDAAAASGAPRTRAAAPPTAGFVGFPNVGKSSTLNALFGRKKAAVAPTPGRTKHFQTLDVPGRELTLCDCPGLVLPRAAVSKADMVAAGVVPIDRLTDMRSPATVVAARVPRADLEAIYGVSLGGRDEGGSTSDTLTGATLLRTVAASRGWVVQNALPDEARAGRLVLRDYCSGRLPHWEWPPGWSERGDDDTASPAPATPAARPRPAAADDPLSPPDMAALALEDDAGGDGEAAAAAAAAARPRRAPHKFHMRPTRSKGDRGLNKDGGAYDGGALVTGRKGGLVRPPAAV